MENEMGKFIPGQVCTLTITQNDDGTCNVTGEPDFMVLLHKTNTPDDITIVESYLLEAYIAALHLDDPDPKYQWPESEKQKLYAAMERIFPSKGNRP